MGSQGKSEARDVPWPKQMGRTWPVIGCGVLLGHKIGPSVARKAATSARPQHLRTSEIIPTLVLVQVWAGQGIVRSTSEVGKRSCASFPSSPVPQIPHLIQQAVSTYSGRAPRSRALRSPGDFDENLPLRRSRYRLVRDADVARPMEHGRAHRSFLTHSARHLRSLDLAGIERGKEVRREAGSATFMEPGESSPPPLQLAVRLNICPHTAADGRAT